MTTALKRLALAAVAILLAACGSAASPSPSPTAPTPTASTLPDPDPDASVEPSAPPSSAPTGDAIPTRNMTVPADVAQAPLDAFFDMQTDPELSFRVVQEGSFRSGEIPLGDFRYEIARSGRDAEATGSVAGQELEIVIVDDEAWVRTGDAWTATTREAISGDDIVDVLRYTGDRDDFVFVGLEGDGSYRYAAVRDLPYETSAMRDSGAEGAIDAMTLVIDENGEPVRMTFSFHAEQPTGQGGSIPIEGDSTLTFSDWRGPIAIEAPDVP
jgi:hypothetical protein